MTNWLRVVIGRLVGPGIAGLHSWDEPGRPDEDALQQEPTDKMSVDEKEDKNLTGE